MESQLYCIYETKGTNIIVPCILICLCTPFKQEFRAIGIKKRGFVLRLEKATTKLPPMVIETKVPVRSLAQHFFDE